MVKLCKWLLWLIGALFVLFLAGCSHNPAVFTMGTRTNVGFDPGQLSANISWSDGLNIVDVPRENSSFEIEVDESVGLTFDKATNTIKGIRKITRKTGIQITGYLVELADISPEAAIAYIAKAIELNESYQPTISNVPIPQARGIINGALLKRIEERMANDETTEVPPEISMTINEWKLLKAIYFECPQYLVLTKAEEASIIGDNQ